jgi:cellulose synthase/poly-beta-1,6-N-acetylglucosamine synthase-like glycosyltransferase
MAYGFLLLLGVSATGAALYSLHLGAVYDRKVTATLARPSSGYAPSACLIMACKGDEPGLAANMDSILRQEYGDYATIIVVDSSNDPAYRVAESVIAQHPGLKVTLLTSEPHVQASGKVAALLTAINVSRGQAEVYAFVDSDASVPTNWLRDLIDPLADPTAGASTGFRWYFGSPNHFWSHVQSAWSASGSNLLFNDKYNFPWGGAMAARAETLEKIGIRQVWETAVSDDLSLNSSLRKYGYKTIFLPQCTVATRTEIDFRELIEWATNQTALVRAYNRPLWKYALLAYGFFNVTFMLGVISLILGILSAPAWMLPGILLVLPAPVGIFRSARRVGSFRRAIPTLEPEFDRTPTMSNISSLIVPWIMIICLLKSTRTNEIEWRGRKYRLAPS